MNVALAAFVTSGLGLLALPSAIGFDLVFGAVMRKRLRAELERSGLSAVVQPLTPVTLAGSRDGVPVTIHYNATKPLPGTRTQSEVEDPEGTWLTSPSPGPDLMVCRRDLTDLILGPLPGGTKHRTGDAAFDARFDVIVTEPINGSVAFPPPALRAPLAELGLQWLRRRDGHLEAMFGVLGPNQVAAVSEIAVALAAPTHAAECYRGGPSARAITVPASALERHDYDRVYVPILLGFAVAILFGILGGSLLPLTETSHAIFADVACEAGYRPVQTRSEAPDGTYIGVQCEKAGSPSAPARDLLYVSCAALATSPPLGFGLLFTLLRFLRALRRWLGRPEGGERGAGP